MNEALAALQEHFALVFVGGGLTDTPRHRAVVRAFCRAESHVTVDEIIATSREEGGEPTRETVLFVMSRLCEYGLASAVKLGDGMLRYEHSHPDQHHDHLICTRCKKIVNFYDNRLEELKEAVAMQRRFHPTRHRLEIFGLCGDCMPHHADLRPLTEVEAGETVRIASMGSQRRFVRRLADLGLIPDAEVQVVNNAGPIIVALGNTRVALGRGMASKILVK